MTGDFPVSQNLSINTGGILVYNQFSFDDNSMFGVAMEALPNYYGSEDLTAIDESGFVDYEFMAVDFPLNMRMQLLNDSRKQFFVSAGVSSFLYLQQSFSRNAEIMRGINNLIPTLRSGFVICKCKNNPSFYRNQTQSFGSLLS
ncbi:MAG: hypothetical protein K0B37_09395 [Bacteroidales bacterium]|nr:hypothetical protein [Bacteroidales bacterium]